MLPWQGGWVLFIYLFIFVERGSISLCELNSIKLWIINTPPALSCNYLYVWNLSFSFLSPTLQRERNIKKEEDRARNTRIWVNFVLHNSFSKDPSFYYSCCLFLPLRETPTRGERGADRAVCEIGGREDLSFWVFGL